jgi:transposase
MGKETTRLRRTFTPQFKKDAVRLVTEEGKSLTEVAAHLGIARSLLQRWREQLSSKRATEVSPGHGRVSGQPQKVRELEKKLRDVTMERDILKNVWFARTVQAGLA